MPIKINCPKCNQSIEVPDHMRGSTGTCPNCDQEIHIDGPPLPITKSGLQTVLDKYTGETVGIFRGSSKSDLIFAKLVSVSNDCFTLTYDKDKQRLIQHVPFTYIQGIVENSSGKKFKDVSGFFKRTETSVLIQFPESEGGGWMVGAAIPISF